MKKNENVPESPKVETLEVVEVAEKAVEVVKTEDEAEKVMAILATTTRQCFRAWQAAKAEVVFEEEFGEDAEAFEAAKGREDKAFVELAKAKRFEREYPAEMLTTFLAESLPESISKALSQAGVCKLVLVFVPDGGIEVEGLAPIAKVAPRAAVAGNGSEKGAEIYRLHVEEGLTWGKATEAVGLKSPGDGVHRARKWAQANGAKWPVG